MNDRLVETKSIEMSTPLILAHQILTLIEKFPANDDERRVAVEVVKQVVNGGHCFTQSLTIDK
jgi:hypothetical protein